MFWMSPVAWRKQQPSKRSLCCTLGALGQDYFLRLGAAWMRHGGIEPGANVTVKLSLKETQEGKRQK
jgi:hypothetical protein